MVYLIAIGTSVMEKLIKKCIIFSHVSSPQLELTFLENVWKSKQIHTSTEPDSFFWTCFMLSCPALYKSTFTVKFFHVTLFPAKTMCKTQKPQFLYLLWQRANAWKMSFRSLLLWPIYTINLILIKPNYQGWL